MNLPEFCSPCRHLPFDSAIAALARLARCSVATAFLFGISLAACSGSSAEAAFTSTTFGSNGESGSLNGEALAFGSGGDVYELDAFFAIAGQDLNGFTSGTVAQLSTHPLPSSINFGFSFQKSDGGLTLSYRFKNTSTEAINSPWFSVFVDSQIDEPINGYVNEFGLPIGTIGAGAADPDPDDWEIDEPGYIFGDIFSNLLSGSLDNTNAMPESQPDDVSLALAFDLGSLPPLATAIVDVRLSDNGSMVGSYALRHFDSSGTSVDILTISGQARVEPVPEPATGISIIVGCFVAVLLFRGRRVGSKL